MILNDPIQLKIIQKLCGIFKFVYNTLYLLSMDLLSSEEKKFLNIRVIYRQK